MIASLILNIVTGSKVRTATWIAEHLSAYVILLANAVALLVYSLLFLKRKKPSRRLGIVMTAVFSGLCLLFGIYISFLDYKKGEQVLTFVTMEVFVMCLFAWRPIVNFFMTAGTFVAFYLLCEQANPASYATKVNLFTTWVAVFVSGIAVYYQHYVQAEKGEVLENVNKTLLELAETDSLTGIPNNQYFLSHAPILLQDRTVDLSEFVFLFLDIENFKNYNEKHGFERGSDFLRICAELLKLMFPDDLISRASDDQFIILAKIRDTAELEKKIDFIRGKVRSSENEVKLDVKVGSYRPTDRNFPVAVACDRARYACNSIKKRFDKTFCEYDEKMGREQFMKQYIINNIDNAVEKGYIVPYYQPVVWASDKTLCGLEALARWKDPKYGMFSPAEFIPVLEEYRQIHKVDVCIMESACRDIQEMRESGNPVIPISLNFSRLDFEMVDIVSEVENCRKKYGVSNDELHIEITESALNENDSLITRSMDNFRTRGYALWLDDFGSGYSGLNVLKDFSFDMMKIDMKFLRNFTENKKTRPILKSIVMLANNINMQTLTEGVETSDVAEFLESIGCQRLQGYLFGKPMPKEELLQKIRDGIYVVAVKK